MPVALEIALIVVLVALTAGLLPLFFHLGQAARSLDSLLQGAQKELARMSEDAHASRVRMDQLADSLQVSLDEFARVAKVAGSVGRTVDELQSQFKNSLETVSRILGSLLGLLGPVLAALRSPSTPHGEEPRSEP